MEKLLDPLSGLLIYFNKGTLETLLTHLLVSDIYRAKKKSIDSRSNNKRSAVQMMLVLLVVNGVLMCGACRSRYHCLQRLHDPIQLLDL